MPRHFCGDYTLPDGYARNMREACAMAVDHHPSFGMLGLKDEPTTNMINVGARMLPRTLFAP